MPHVMSQCFSYLKSQLTVRNCVKSFLLASAKKSWAQIASFIRNFIIVHFDQVRKFGSIYKLLNKEQFSEIVRSENLNVRYEEGTSFKSQTKIIINYPLILFLHFLTFSFHLTFECYFDLFLHSYFNFLVPLMFKLDNFISGLLKGLDK